MVDISRLLKSIVEKQGEEIEARIAIYEEMIVKFFEFGYSDKCGTLVDEYHCLKRDKVFLFSLFFAIEVHLRGAECTDLDIQPRDKKEEVINYLVERETKIGDAIIDFGNRIGRKKSNQDETWVVDFAKRENLKREFNLINEFKFTVIKMVPNIEEYKKDGRKK